MSTKAGKSGDVLLGEDWVSPDSTVERLKERRAGRGIVTLKGEVSSEADAELLPTFARKIPGVVDVHSTLTYRS